MNISHFKNKNIHLVECENWQDVYGYEKSEMKEDIINYIEQLQQENQKYKEVFDKAIEYIKIYRSYQKIDNKDYLKGRDEIGFLDICQVDELLEILKEVE